jgi:3-hydroxyacyl-[acyl-carrier-protein] dehydratase
MNIIDHPGVRDLLPHRFPFLLVDVVKELEPGKSIKAIKNVTANEPFFSGHFPGFPVMPGVLIVEALAQASGILILKSNEAYSPQRDLFYLAGVDKARFKRIVSPGDQLTLEAEVIRNKLDLWKFKCTASVDGELVCACEILNIKGAQMEKQAD